MKFMSRAGIYKAANCTFNPETCTGQSYGWWNVCARVEGKLVVSNFHYSNTTRKHRSTLETQMRELGITPDLYLPLPRGVRFDQTLADMIIEAEEQLCLEFLEQQVKAQERYAARKLRQSAQALLTVVSTETQAVSRE